MSFSDWKVDLNFHLACVSLSAVDWTVVLQLGFHYPCSLAKGISPTWCKTNSVVPDILGSPELCWFVDAIWKTLEQSSGIMLNDRIPGLCLKEMMWLFIRAEHVGFEQKICFPWFLVFSFSLKPKFRCQRPGRACSIFWTDFLTRKKDSSSNGMSGEFDVEMTWTTAHQENWEL